MDQSVLTLLDSPDSASGLNADDMVDKSMGDVISGTRMASDESGWTWTSLRKINYYPQNSHNCTDEAARTKYDGVAYFFRAYFYVKVRRYGDVPWYDTVIGSGGGRAAEKAPRGSRHHHGPRDVRPRRRDRHAPARQGRSPRDPLGGVALQSRAPRSTKVRGAKYRGLPDADKYLQQAADAAATFIAESGYFALQRRARSLTATSFLQRRRQAERSHSGRLYNFEGLNLAHSVQFNIRNAATGFTRRFMNHYLMADGSRFTEKEGHETMFYTEETAGRDPRMAQTVLCLGYVAMGESAATPNDMTAMTGYEPIKFVSTAARSGASKGQRPTGRCSARRRCISTYAGSQGRAGHADAGRPDRFRSTRSANAPAWADSTWRPPTPIPIRSSWPATPMSRRAPTRA